MSRDSNWKRINQQGSGEVPRSTDSPLNPDTQKDVDNANRASDLHQQASELADRSGK